jgi:membrane protein YqaA with SNARE-associated domain
MIAAILAALLVGAVSAIIPITPVEPYLIGVVAATDVAAIPLGIAAGLGQTIGKLLLFGTVRGAVRSDYLRRVITRKVPVTAQVAGEDPPAVEAAAPKRGRALLERTRVVMQTLDQPRQAVPILFASAFLGFPPLLLVTVYAARGPMPVGLFAAVCVVGRCARFVVIALAPAAVMNLPFFGH